MDVNNFCAQISSTASPNPVHLDESVLLEMKAIAKTYPFIKWQYFGSEEGMLTAFPVFFNENDCSKYDPRYRPFYVETATPEAKDVVLIIDTSASMIGEKLVIAREAANTVLDTMNPKDHVSKSYIIRNRLKLSPNINIFVIASINDDKAIYQAGREKGPCKKCFCTLRHDWPAPGASEAQPLPTGKGL